MARDHVAARIERYRQHHHHATVLKPLDDLARAEDLQGLAKRSRLPARRKSRNVLFRRDVADDVKSLDQDAPRRSCASTASASAPTMSSCPR
jgi:ATP-dependent RNA helicase SUPV3L1/SUV3